MVHSRESWGVLGGMPLVGRLVGCLPIEAKWLAAIFRQACRSVCRGDPPTSLSSALDRLFDSGALCHSLRQPRLSFSSLLSPRSASPAVARGQRHRIVASFRRWQMELRDTKSAVVTGYSVNGKPAGRVRTALTRKARRLTTEQSHIVRGWSLHLRATRLLRSRPIWATLHGYSRNRRYEWWCDVTSRLPGNEPRLEEQPRFAHPIKKARR
jgi:hypothetical protein